ncbi:hypothetical protein ACWEQ5_32730 [Streptomyces griseoincarnatus]|uniref:hypothetical protein n=1 Tax=Streptomyces tunisiensis TaxID=948699 RepID=UPI003EE240F2
MTWVGRGRRSQEVARAGAVGLLEQVIVITPSPRQFAELLVVCLEPFYDNLYETLMEQLAEDPVIFCFPADETGVVGFGEAWLGALRDLSGRDGGAGGGPGERPTKRS